MEKMQSIELNIADLVNALSENESKIRNVRAFILTAAHNAPSNMDAYYTALVSYDWSRCTQTMGSARPTQPSVNPLTA